MTLCEGGGGGGRYRNIGELDSWGPDLALVSMDFRPSTLSMLLPYKASFLWHELIKYKHFLNVALNRNQQFLQCNVSQGVAREICRLRVEIVLRLYSLHFSGLESTICYWETECWYFRPLAVTICTGAGSVMTRSRTTPSGGTTSRRSSAATAASGRRFSSPVLGVGLSSAM